MHIRHLPLASRSHAALQIRDFPDPALYNVRMSRTVHTACLTTAPASYYISASATTTTLTLYGSAAENGEKINIICRGYK